MKLGSNKDSQFHTCLNTNKAGKAFCFKGFTINDKYLTTRQKKQKIIRIQKREDFMNKSNFSKHNVLHRRITTGRKGKMHFCPHLAILQYQMIIIKEKHLTPINHSTKI